MIVVEYDSDVLGKGEFWRGPEDDIDQIRNMPAQKIARKVAKDGQQRTFGMWTVRQEEDQE